MHFDLSRSARGPRERGGERRRRAALGAAIALCVAAVSSACAAPIAVQGGGLELNVTLGRDVAAGACGSDTELDVTRLDVVNFCYTVSNTSDVTLAYQTLADDVTGTLLSAVPQPIAAGATYRYNRIITARESQSPVSTWTGYDVHPGYGIVTDPKVPDRVFADGFDGSASGYDFVDITGVGTPLNMDNDDLSTQVDVGFAFSFYGQTATQLLVAYNGGILFDLDSIYFSPQNVPLPDADLGAAILPYWTDIYYQQPEDGNIYVATLGEAPNRRFVAEWFNLPIMIGGIQQDSATFEAILYEGSNEIVFQYADTDVGDPTRNDGITATIGLNAPPDAQASLQYSYKTASVGAGTAIHFAPTTPVTQSASQQVVLAVGVPQISVSPTAFDMSAAAGGSTASTLSIGNVGNRALTWNVGSFSPSAHFPAEHRTRQPRGNPALTSGAPAPRNRSHASGGAHASAVPQAGGAVPAFAIDLDSSSLLGLDAASPTNLTTIGSVGDLILTTGAFVDEDFSHLYTIDYYTYHLLAIDTSTGEIELVGTAELENGAGVNWSGMAWDATTNTLYGTAYTQTRDGISSFLYTIDPVTAATALVGPITGIDEGSGEALVIDIAVDSNGLMYGVDIVGDTFVAIDKTNGAGAIIKLLDFDANFAQGLDFDAYTGTLYYAAFDNGTQEAEMYTVDPLSGDMEFVSTIGADPFNTQLAAFAIARLGGVCAYPNDVPWLRYDTTRGSTAAGDSTPVHVTFDASTLTPGTYSGNVCIANNDMTNRRVAVPVTFTVE